LSENTLFGQGFSDTVTLRKIYDLYFEKFDAFLVVVLVTLIG